MQATFGQDQWLFFNSQVDQTKSLFAFVTSLDDKHGCVNVCSVRYEMNADVVGLE